MRVHGEAFYGEGIRFMKGRETKGERGILRDKVVV